MSKKKVLIVTQEMQPYTEATQLAEIARRLPQFVQENGMEIRVLMPRYGTINERRHRLHEVVRLSGMNIIVDDDDYPLIIKVASLQEARMQVYFLDNEDFFKRKAIFKDNEGKVFEDNADRMVFFCKGVIETVKKFGWPPDIIHCHGWMTSLLPLYVKTAYKSEPLFQDSKIVYSAYESDIEKQIGDSFEEKATINSLSDKDLDVFRKDNGIHLHDGAIAFSDAVIKNDNLSAALLETIEASGKPSLQTEGEDYLAEYIDFYNTLIGEEVEK
jgi:starch synthase